jgi:hypothetical protein
MAGVINLGAFRTARNTTGYRTPALPKPKPLTNPYSAQASKNTTGMPLTAPGGGPTVTPYVPQTAPVVATVQKPPAGTAPPAAPGDTQSVFDLSTDPIVQKIRALNTQQYGAAVAQTDSTTPSPATRPPR